ncbi:MAG: hypothetical protein ACOYN5_13845 [Bacteroidales bacterium]
METRLFKQLIIVVLLLSAVSVSAQKKLLIKDADTIIMTAKKCIETDLQPEGKIREIVDKHQLSGLFDVDLTINEKGEVVSVFFQQKPEIEIKKISYFREFLNSYTFPFKTPKGRKYKFNYQFNF